MINTVLCRDRRGDPPVTSFHISDRHMLYRHPIGRVCTVQYMRTISIHPYVHIDKTLFVDQSPIVRPTHIGLGNKLLSSWYIPCCC
jgi:hypothetical protein